MPMDPDQQKEQFSNAYFRAVAAVAGYNAYKPEVDDSSVDWGLKGYRENGMNYIPQLEMQLKCKGNDQYLRRTSLSYSLKRKNYNELCDTSGIIPRILIVVMVPRVVEQWLTQSEEQLVLKYCGYWAWLGTYTPIQENSKTVYLDRTNVFNVDQLQQLMHTIGMTGRLP